MASIDECLVVVRRTIGLVGSEVEVGVVTPRVIAVKFHDRHQFYSIYAETLDVRDFLHCFTDSTVGVGFTFSAGEVTEEHFVDDEVRLVDTLEVGHFPVVVVDVVVIDSKHHIAQLCRVRDQVRVNAFRDILIVVRVKDKLSVRVAHLVLTVDEVIVRILLAGFETFNLHPEIAIAVVVLIVHDIVVHDIIVVPRWHEDSTCLLRSGETEHNRAIGILDSTHLRHTARIVLGYRSSRIAEHSLIGRFLTTGCGLGSDSVVAVFGEIVSITQSRSIVL